MHHPHVEQELVLGKNQSIRIIIARQKFIRFTNKVTSYRTCPVLSKNSTRTIEFVAGAGMSLIIRILKIESINFRMM
jgi:hypothetical protein